MKSLIRIVAIAAFCAAASERQSVGRGASERESAASAATVSPSNAPTLSLETVLRDVLQSNPSLKAARANWEAMKQRVPQARAWEDAKAGFDSVAGRFVNLPPNAMTD